MVGDVSRSGIEGAYTFKFSLDIYCQIFHYQSDFFFFSSSSYQTSGFANWKVENCLIWSLIFFILEYVYLYF